MWVVALTVVGCRTAGALPTRISDDFAGSDGLIAAENRPGTDAAWIMTSGSLFRSDGMGWSGRPDGGGPAPATGSAVFRMVSADRSLSDVDVKVKLRVDELVETPRTPAQDFDGVHIWVRYQSAQQLYAVSVDRRDGSMVIKKKCEGGTDNGGTYYDLTPFLPGAAIPFGEWQDVTVAVRDLPDGSVRINASRDGKPIEAVDTGLGCAPLLGGGGVGVRGDNAEFRLASVTVADLVE